MIVRLVELLLLGTVVIRFMTGQWPWERWPWLLGQGRGPSQSEKRARVLLGVAPDAGREQIIDAHRRLLTQIHPDRGGSSEAVHEANDARDLLLERLGLRNRG